MCFILLEDAPISWDTRVKVKVGEPIGMSSQLTWSFLPSLGTALVLSAARHAPETEVTHKVNKVNA